MSTNTNKSTGGGTLPPCAICNAKNAIYRCPRCHTCTCSLECCRIHKKGGDSKGSNNNTNNKPCDGKRDRTQFCSIKGFTDSQLSSDYHFLEDVLKVSESTKRMYHGIVAGDSTSNTTSSTKRARTMIKTGGRVDLDSISTQQQQSDHPLLQAKEGKSIISVLANGVADNDDVVDTNTEQAAKQSHNNPKNGIINELLGNNKPASKPPPSGTNSNNKKREKIDPLIRQAELKGVNLLRMPPGMERRKSNTTKFNKKKGIITWKVELCFHLPNDTNDISESVSANEEKKSLPKLLKVETDVLDSSTLSEELGKHLDVHPGNSTTRSQLRQFTTVPRESLLVFIKRLPCRSSSPQYYKLDPSMTLMELLKGKTIIEFPTIDVVITSDDVGSRFPLFIGEVG